MNGAGGGADVPCGMSDGTAPAQGRQRVSVRLLHDLEALDALTAERPSAQERLADALGPELAARLVHALTRGGASQQVVAA